MSSDGKISIHAPLKPLNDNPKLSIVDANYIKGADQIFQSIADLVAFHPSKMVQAMTARVNNYPKIGDVTEYFLKRNPADLVDSNDDTIITIENFTSYWEQRSQNNSGVETIREYAPSKSGGARPTFPYTPASDAADGWTPIYDPQLNHRWVRVRTDDVDDNSDGVFDNWSIPVSLGVQYTQNDYVENRFIRQDVSLTLLSNSSGFQTDKYYIVLSGTITVNGTVRTKGSIFQHKAANSYTFNSATARETLAPPPSVTAQGNPNNEPIGYSDTIPAGTEMLWIIEAQKSAYGDLKSDWIIRRVKEDPNYIRYSNSPSPDPNTIVGTGVSAAAATQGDTDLDNSGWSNTYSEQNFIATRQDDNGGSAGPPFTQWRVEKINEESGEFQEYSFKLFDFNLPIDSPALVAPTNADPTSEGWFDTPRPETATKKNYVTIARKFIDGTLKTAWSKPVPYTSSQGYLLSISSSNDDDFKKDQNGVVAPATIELTAELFKGVEKLWENGDVSLAFSWKRVYDNATVVDNDATSNTASDFYFLGEAGTAGTDGYKYSGQRLVVKPDAVTGKAVFRATVVVTMDEGDDITISKDFSILDVSDGKDAKDLSISADSQRVIYDTGNTVFIPAQVELRAFYSNLGNPTLYWYRKNGSSWDAISNGGAYTISGNFLQIDTATLFTGDGSAEEEKFAVSTDDTDPTNADGDTIFTDYKTIVKLGSTSVANDGADALSAILDNESATIVLDATSVQPVADETGNTGRIVTKLELYEGLTKKVYGGGNDYTVAVAPTTGDIQFGVEADGDDALIFIDDWSSSTARSATATITITFGAVTIEKKWQIGSTLDAPGALILDIDSDKGLSFTPQDRSNKTLTASLFDTSQETELQTSGYEYHWRVAGVFGSWSTSRTQVVTRANVATAADVTVEVRRVGETEVLRSRTVRLYDIVDSRIVLMQTDAVSANATNKIPSTQLDNSTVTVAGVTWRSVSNAYWETNEPTYACQGEENPSDITAFIWTNPYRIKGEKGDQGIAGIFRFRMYKPAGTSLPSGSGAASTLSQMTADGWVADPPQVANVYTTERFFVGQGVTFDGNNLPSTDPVTGTEWTTPIVFTGQSGNDGGDGNDGNDGNDGWTPQFSVVSDGARRVLRLIDWIGGEGTKPGNVGNYVGPSGFTGSIGSATDIRGAAGVDGTNGLDGSTKVWASQLTPSQSGSDVVGQSVFLPSNASRNLLITANVYGVTNLLGATTTISIQRKPLGIGSYVNVVRRTFRDFDTVSGQNFTVQAVATTSDAQFRVIVEDANVSFVQSITLSIQEVQ